jgi:hypothetical protein
MTLPIIAGVIDQLEGPSPEFVIPAKAGIHGR